MLELLFTNPLYFSIFVAALLVAVTIHEFAHAWVADRLGDPTPRINDRVTLNPLAHLDPIGTLALLVAHIGWGKPVPIDPFNLKSPRRDSALISLAGPASNLVLAGLLSLGVRLVYTTSLPGLLISIASPVISLNVGLAIFNLLPIPPLDGAKILLGLLPAKLAYQVEDSLSQYGTLILILLILPLFNGQPLAVTIISPIIRTILAILLP